MISAIVVIIAILLAAIAGFIGGIAFFMHNVVKTGAFTHEGTKYTVTAKEQTEDAINAMSARMIASFKRGDFDGEIWRANKRNQARGVL